MKRGLVSGITYRGMPWSTMRVTEHVTMEARVQRFRVRTVYRDVVKTIRN